MSRGTSQAEGNSRRALRWWAWGALALAASVVAGLVVSAVVALVVARASFPTADGDPILAVTPESARVVARLAGSDLDTPMRFAAQVVVSDETSTDELVESYADEALQNGWSEYGSGGPRRCFVKARSDGNVQVLDIGKFDGDRSVVATPGVEVVVSVWGPDSDARETGRPPCGWVRNFMSWYPVQPHEG